LPGGFAEKEKSMETKSYKSMILVTGTGNAVSAGVSPHPIKAPELQILGQREADNADGSHTVCIPVEVVADSAPKVLALHVIVDGLISAELGRAEGSNFYSADIPSPAGLYELTIQMAQRSHIQLNAHF
jgi:hypothetical protein